MRDVAVLIPAAASAHGSDGPRQAVLRSAARRSWRPPSGTSAGTRASPPRPCAPAAHVAARAACWAPASPSSRRGHAARTRCAGPRGGPARRPPRAGARRRPPVRHARLVDAVLAAAARRRGDLRLPVPRPQRVRDGLVEATSSGAGSGRCRRRSLSPPRSCAKRTTRRVVTAWPAPTTRCGRRLGHRRRVVPGSPAT